MNFSFINTVDSKSGSQFNNDFFVVLREDAKVISSL